MFAEQLHTGTRQPYEPKGTRVIEKIPTVVLESQFSPTLMNVKLSKLRKLWVCFLICRVGISYRTYLIGRFQFYLSCPRDGFEDVKQYLARRYYR